MTMTQQRNHFTADEKVSILRKHLLEKVPISTLCDQHKALNPNLFYRWQKEFFERGTAAFERQPDGPDRKQAARISALEAKLAHKDSVIAEIMEAHVALKKSLGEI
jgi:transposase